MELTQTLTKENFWNEVMEKYPKATKQFCDWIDEYKNAVSWNDLFRGPAKYHDLPYAMQYGIWIEYCSQILSNYFEQLEHISDTVDLAEDINICFKEMEELIDPQ